MIIAAGDSELLGYDDVYRVTDLDRRGLPARVTVTYHRRARTAGCDRDRDCQWPGILSEPDGHGTVTLAPSRSDSLNTMISPAAVASCPMRRGGGFLPDAARRWLLAGGSGVISR